MTRSRLVERRCRRLIREALGDSRQYAVGGNTFDMKVLEDLYPDAYDALPSSYQADPHALTFQIDSKDRVIATYEDYKMPQSVWDPDTQEWKTHYPNPRSRW